MDLRKLSYSDSAPYPDIKVCGQNYRYAGWMLDNLGGSNSEMSAVSLYLYNNLVTGCDSEDISTIFHNISIVEMHHLEIFGKLALQLGEDPRLWTRCRSRKIYWTPGYNQYPTELSPLVHNALSGELAAIEKYENQICSIDDPFIVENLKRIVEDEQIHVNLFREMITLYCL